MTSPLRPSPLFKSELFTMRALSRNRLIESKFIFIYCCCDKDFDPSSPERGSDAGFRTEDADLISVEENRDNTVIWE